MQVVQRVGRAAQRALGDGLAGKRVEAARVIGAAGQVPLHPAAGIHRRDAPGRARKAFAVVGVAFGAADASDTLGLVFGGPTQRASAAAHQVAVVVSTVTRPRASYCHCALSAALCIEVRCPWPSLLLASS